MSIEKFQSKVQPVIGKISSSKFLQAIMAGMMGMLPATMIGSIATLLKNIQIASWQSFLTNTALGSLLTIAINCTTNIIALIMVVGIADATAKANEVKTKGAGFLALVCFLIITPFASVVNDYGMTSYQIPMTYLGSAGMFSAIIVGSVVGSLFSFIVKKGLVVKMPDSVPPFITDAFSAMIPGIIIGALFLVVRGIFDATSFGSLHACIYTLLQKPLTNLGGTVGSLLVVILVTKILWLFGIHGAMVTLSIMSPILMALDYANQAAVAAGEAIPNVIGNAFYGTSTIAGGMVALGICMLFAKSKKYKTLAKVCFIPSIFGISEPMMFGVPLVLNFSMAVPFIFSPVITMLLAYALTKVGILPVLPGVSAPTGTPVILQGFIAGGWRWAIFQAVMVVLLVAFWWPFFHKDDMKELALEEASESEETAIEGN